MLIRLYLDAIIINMRVANEQVVPKFHMT